MRPKLELYGSRFVLIAMGILRTQLLAFAALCCAGVGVACADMYLQGVNGDHAMSATHDRFYAGVDKAFVGEGLDWSGVGRSSNGTWVTMISPTHFVSANHYHPNAGDTITFHEDNNLGGVTHAYTVAADAYATTYDGVSSDLWLGKLTAPLDPAHHVATYPVLMLGADASYMDLHIMAYGAPDRVGTGMIGAVVDDFEIGRTRTMRWWFHAEEGTGTGAGDCHLIGGDSGGPSFAVLRGRLALVGVHFTTNDTNGVFDPEDSWPLGFGWSGDSFVPFYVDQLDAHMGAERTGRMCGVADLNCDGHVNGIDLGLLLGAWGQVGATFDLTGDNRTDGADVGVLLGAWGN